jgi:hypothetical protein
MILGIWIGTIFQQEELNKVEVGHVEPGACQVGAAESIA